MDTYFMRFKKKDCKQPDTRGSGLICSQNWQRFVLFLEVLLERGNCNHDGHT